MKLGWHTKHFKNAFGTLKNSKSLLAIAPFGVFVGIGALIDATLLILQTAFINPGSVSYKINSAVTYPLATLIILLFLTLSVVAQNVVIISTYKQAHKKTAKGWRELKAGFCRLGKSLTIHLTSSFLIFAVVSVIILLPKIQNPALLVIIVLFTAFIILAILTAKMIVLQMSVGGNHNLSHSVKATWLAFKKSWLAIVEHNVILFCINILMLIFIFIITYIATLSLTVLASVAVAYMGISFQNIFLLTPVIIGLPIILFLAGTLLIVNMASWSELTKSIRRRAVPSALKRFAKKILPI